MQTQAYQQEKSNHPSACKTRQILRNVIIAEPINFSPSSTKGLASLAI